MYCIISDEIEVIDTKLLTDKITSQLYWVEIYVPDPNNMDPQINNIYHNYPIIDSYLEIGIIKAKIPINQYYELYFSPNNSYELFINNLLAIKQINLDLLPRFGIASQNKSSNQSTSQVEPIPEIAPDDIIALATSLFNNFKIDIERNNDLFNDVVKLIIDNNERELIITLSLQLIKVLPIEKRDPYRVYHQIIAKYGTLEDLYFYEEVADKISKNKTAKLDKLTDYINDNFQKINQSLQLFPERFPEILSYHKDMSNKLPLSDLVSNTKLHESFIKYANINISKEEAIAMLEGER